MNGWSRRFLSSSRGQIVALLRRTSRTVDEMARALDLTDNGVRAHLSTLERDGLVRQRGVRRGARKPAYEYELTPEAERLFPKPYGLVLRHLLDGLATRMSAAELDALLREAGHRLAAGQEMPTDDVRGRLAAAVRVLNDLGGLAELEERDGAFVIRGYSCPLAEVVPGHPEVCKLAESTLSGLVEMPVRETCDRGDSPRCSFEVTVAGADRRAGDDGRGGPGSSA